MEYITSDLHFFHKNILKFCPSTRPYDSVQAMNEMIIHEWNTKLHAEDTLYFLGDFAFGKIPQIEKLLSRLNECKVYFILGNHDRQHKDLYSEWATWCGDYYEYKTRIDGKATMACMFHYPIHEWNKQHHGSVHFHGHTHNKFFTRERMRDVGWDNGKYHGLIPLETAIKDCLKDPIVTEHHK